MLNIPVDISLLIAIIGCALALLAFFDGRRKLAMQEGKHIETVEQLRGRVGTAETKVEALTACYQTTDADIREIKTDITWIKGALEEIKGKLT